MNFVNGLNTAAVEALHNVTIRNLHCSDKVVKVKENKRTKICEQTNHDMKSKELATAVKHISSKFPVPPINFQNTNENTGYSITYIDYLF